MLIFWQLSGFYTIKFRLIPYGIGSPGISFIFKLKKNTACQVMSTHGKSCHVLGIAQEKGRVTFICKWFRDFCIILFHMPKIEILEFCIKCNHCISASYRKVKKNYWTVRKIEFSLSFTIKIYFKFIIISKKKLYTLD